MTTTRRRAAVWSLILVALVSCLAGVVLGRAWGVSPPAEPAAPAEPRDDPATSA